MEDANRPGGPMVGTAAPESYAVGNFAASPIERVAQFLTEPDDASFHRRLREELHIDNAPFASALRKSCEICRRGSLLYPASEELVVSFNGGKDACVVLYLWLAALVGSRAPDAHAPWAIFFDSSKEFESIRTFVGWVVRTLGLRLRVITQCSFRQGMEDLVAQGVRAVVMGQRRDDPWMAKVDAFSPSTDGWPAFMRVNPIIDWSYSHIWTFLRGFGLPYCVLYDEGYTSLGNVNDTLRNPWLQRHDGSYGPAHELQDASLERAGRESSNKAGQLHVQLNGSGVTPVALAAPEVAPGLPE